MRVIGVHADLEGSQKKWVFGAIGIAIVFHLIFAWALGWYKIPGLEIPSRHSAPTGPFTVKSIEINPDAYKPQQENPINKLPVVDPASQSPAQFNLDPNLVEKALQTPQPTLPTPSIPDAGKVVAAADMTQGLPFAESDTAKVSAEIAKIDPATTTGPVSSSKFAQELISAGAGPTQMGTPGGAAVSADKTGNLPGFASLASGFRPGSPDLSKLPEPVLLRLPSDVLFDFDSATLKPEASPLLSQAIGMITKYPEADIRIDGYSDSFGRTDYNLTLSQQRAQAVQEWMQQHIPQAGYKFSSLGHGSSNYVVSSQGTIEQQQPNRRVEILIQAMKR